MWWWHIFFLCCWLLVFYTCKLPVFHWVRQIYCCYYAIYTFIGSLGKSSRKMGIFYCWLELKWNENQWKMEQVEQKESWGIRLKLRGNETELMMWVFCCDIILEGFSCSPFELLIVIVSLNLELKWMQRITFIEQSIKCMYKCMLCLCTVKLNSLSFSFLKCWLDI